MRIRTLLAPTAMALTLGCDPAAGVRARAQLYPVPRVGCIDSTLAVTPAVRLLGQQEWGDPRKIRTRSYQLSFDEPGEAERQASLDVESRPDSNGALEVTFIWMGVLEGVPEPERDRMASLGTNLLVALRDACLPTTPLTVVCTEGGFGSRSRNWSCASPR